MTDDDSLPYELIDRGTAVQILVNFADGANYTQDVPLTLDNVLKVRVRYVERGLTIVVIGRGLRSYGYYISPAVLQELHTKYPS